MIISLFGPDGVGKTAAAEKIGEQLSLPVISGSDITSWHDLSWYESFIAQGIDESSITDLEHFFDLVKHAHHEAVAIDAVEGGVVLDSDPFHKVFLHQVVHEYTQTMAIPGLIQRLETLAGHDTTRQWAHLHMRVSRTGSQWDHALEMQQRMRLRGELSPYDPTTPEESVDLIRVSNMLDRQLRRRGYQVLNVYSDEPDELLRTVEVL